MVMQTQLAGSALPQHCCHTAQSDMAVALFAGNPLMMTPNSRTDTRAHPPDDLADQEHHVGVNVSARPAPARVERAHA
jgi:hypothetical protein